MKLANAHNRKNKRKTHWIECTLHVSLSCKSETITAKFSQLFGDISERTRTRNRNPDGGNREFSDLTGEFSEIFLVERKFSNRKNVNTAFWIRPEESFVLLKPDKLPFDRKRLRIVKVFAGEICRITAEIQQIATPFEIEKF